MIDVDLLALLACPRCDSRPPLAEVGDRLECTQCRHTYPIVDGIPRLLAAEALPPEKPIE